MAAGVGVGRMGTSGQRPGICKGEGLHSPEAELGTWARKRCSVGLWDRVVL